MVDNSGTVISHKPPGGTWQDQFASGGETQKTGLHWLDGSIGKPERVLSAEQTEAFNKLVADIPTLLKSMDITKSIIAKMPSFDVSKLITGTQNTTSQVFHIAKLEFPNVTSSREIEKAILNLPRLALQR
jgi:hypothetical protein